MIARDKLALPGRLPPAFLAAGLLFTASGAAAQNPNAAAAGTWINPKHTVKIETKDCAGKLCGFVVWADPTAARDAAEGGVSNLVGTELLRDYSSTGSGKWQGQVFVPDMGRSFSSMIRQLDRNHLKISGCIFGGLICKSQVWERV